MPWAPFNPHGDPRRGRKKRAPGSPHPRAYKPTVAGQYLQIFGFLSNGTTSKSHAVVVLPGEDAPTITGGFAKWGVIDRPQRVGMTVLQGYDPIVLTVSLRFDAVVVQPGQSSKELEADIAELEWMGGRGKLYAADGKTFAAGQGDSPLIQIFSADGSGNPTALIPPNCHDLDFVMSGLTYDSKPLRDVTGNRIRQDATLTLTQHVGAPGTSSDSAATQGKQRKSDQGQFVYFTVRKKSLDTIAKIMSTYYGDSKHADWVTVRKDNAKNRKVGPSVYSVLPLHTKLKIRKRFTHHV